MEELNLNEFYESKITNPYERVFVVMLTKYLLFDILPEVSPAIWQDAEMEIRMRDGRTLYDNDKERKTNGGLALTKYSVRYIAEKMKKPEILGVLNKTLTRIAREPLDVFVAFGERFNKKHIFEIFYAQPKKRITEFDSKTFAKLFKYPCWLEFGEEAKQQIYEAILEGELEDYEIDYYLGVSEKHEDYAELLPVVKHIIKTTKDSHLLWIAGDVLNLIWLNLPDDEVIQRRFRKEIYDLYWPRIGSSWPIIHYDMVKIDDLNERQIFNDAYGWLTSLSDLGELNPELKEVSVRVMDDDRRPSLKKFVQKMLDGKHINVDDDRIQEILDNFDEVIESLTVEDTPLLDNLILIYSELWAGASSLSDLNKLEEIGALIVELVKKNYPDDYINRTQEKIDKLTAYGKNALSDYRREQEKLAKLIDED